MIRKLFTLAMVSILAGCANHQPPPQDINPRAAIAGNLPYPVLDWKVLTTVADRDKRTMSLLLGNDMAIAAARSNRPYPMGSVIALATWQQWDNPHWYGSRIPGDPMLVELVDFTPSGPKYRSFLKPFLQEQNGPDASERLASIASMKAVPLP